jgi:hypothetical protein
VKIGILTKEEKETYLEHHKNSNIKVGDKVKIVMKAEAHQAGWDNTWEPEMDEAVGQTMEVLSDGNNSGFCCAPVGNGGEKLEKCSHYGYPYFVMRKVNALQLTKAQIAKKFGVDKIEVVD